MKHDSDTPCSSASQDGWLELIRSLREEVRKRIKPKISVTQLAMLTDLTEGLMQLEVYASSFDELLAARKARLERKLVP